MSESKSLSIKRRRDRKNISDPVKVNRSPNRVSVSPLRLRVAGSPRTRLLNIPSNRQRARSSTHFVKTKPNFATKKSVRSVSGSGSGLKFDVSQEMQKRYKAIKEYCVLLKSEQSILKKKLDTLTKRYEKEKHQTLEIQSEFKKKEELQKYNFLNAQKLEERIIQLIFEFRSHRVPISENNVFLDMKSNDYNDGKVNLFFDPKYYSGKHVLVLLNELHVELRLLFSEKNEELEKLREEFYNQDNDKSIEIRKLKENIGKLKFEKNDFRFSATKALQEKTEAMDSRKVIIEESNQLMESLQGNNESLVTEIKHGKKMIKDLHEKLELRDDILRNRQRQVILNTKLNNKLDRAEKKFKDKERKQNSVLLNQNKRFIDLNKEITRLKNENKIHKQDISKLKTESHSWNMRKVNLEINNLKTYKSKIEKLNIKNSSEQLKLNNKINILKNKNKRIKENNSRITKKYNILLRQHRKDERRRKHEIDKIRIGTRPKTSNGEIFNNSKVDNNFFQTMSIQEEENNDNDNSNNNNEQKAEIIIKNPNLSTFAYGMNFNERKELVASKFYKKKLREAEIENEKLKRRIKRLLHKSNMNLEVMKVPNPHLINTNNKKKLSLDDNMIIFGSKKKVFKKSFNFIQEKEKEIKKLKKKNEELQKLLEISISKRSII